MLRRHKTKPAIVSPHAFKISARIARSPQAEARLLPWSRPSTGPERRMWGPSQIVLAVPLRNTIAGVRAHFMRPFLPARRRRMTLYIMPATAHERDARPARSAPGSARAVSNSTPGVRGAWDGWRR